MAYGRFVSEFLKHPKQVGTFTRSSRFLAKEMAKEIDGAGHIIEFGAGTGSVTSEILKHLPESGRLTCFEINPRFCKHLERINDPRLKVINDDAKNCERYVDSIECIVSGLPLRLFSEPQRDSILDISSKSKRYIQLQYTPFLKEKMEHYFQEVKMKLVLLNFPPAFVYVCKTPDK
ncbi:MAG: class I SAM-dependent methyltransferase [Planctomycetota bacterium]|jgi:phospholipid N-methyltransferase